MRDLPPDEFLKHVDLTLWCGDVFKMTTAKCGEIMGKFATGDVVASTDELFEHVRFNGDCADLQRQMVCACLAFAIRGRLYHAEEYKLVPFERSSINN